MGWTEVRPGTSGFCRVNPLAGAFMKPKVWRLTTIVVCVWLAAIQCVSGRSWAGTCPSRPADASHLFGGGRRFASNPYPAPAVHHPQSNPANTSLTGAPLRPFSRVAEVSSDDGDQSDASEFNDVNLEIACAKPNLHCAEWRLSRLDARHTNLFIISKTKPPP
jgi:hypothetical protein